eukprot:GABV01000241.1.p1 GENE.GABV01000241.1~~GABV01000241.1.p1  ORF type:complete len:283 (+),score=84.14 GABV01000241.1:88-849(+)
MPTTTTTTTAATAPVDPAALERAVETVLNRALEPAVRRAIDSRLSSVIPSQLGSMVTQVAEIQHNEIVRSDNGLRQFLEGPFMDMVRKDNARVFADRVALQEERYRTQNLQMAELLTRAHREIADLRDNLAATTRDAEAAHLTNLNLNQQIQELKKQIQRSDPHKLHNPVPAAVVDAEKQPLSASDTPPLSSSPSSPSPAATPHHRPIVRRLFPLGATLSLAGPTTPAAALRLSFCVAFSRLSCCPMACRRLF